MRDVPAFLDGDVCFLVKFGSVSNRMLFKSDDDYKFYLYLLKKYKARCQIKLFAFCLTPQGVSLIAQPYEEEGLNVFLHHLSESYLAYYNENYKEFEPLKAGRYRKLILEDNQTLISCIKEVEFLPVKQLLSDSPMEYPYSSYCARIGSHQNGLLDRYAYVKK
jgi:putative transposase